MPFIEELLGNNLFIIFLAVLIGVLFGRLEIKGFKFGISGTLFAGLALGHFGLTVPHSYFTISLGLFVAAVGLIAAKDIGGVVRSHGIKFIINGFLMTTVAAIITYLGVKAIGGNIDPRLIEGTFTGALTSSPGLGASVEGVTQPVREQITIGHSVAYPFGVLIIIFFEELWPKARNIDLDEEKQKFRKNIKESNQEDSEVIQESEGFSVAGFALTVVLGGILGDIPIPLGPIGTASLGITGGILPTALAVGYIGKIGPIKTRMSQKVLTGLRSLTLAIFLSVVGIEAGKGFIGTIIGVGPSLILITIIEGIGAISIGLILLRGIWSLDWIVTAGAITGGMTSTPGLGAAIEATETEEVGAGYGSTYPFALIGMVIFAKILGLILP
uniref:Integral membrane protein n=1 Tax=uncultured organism TaxID=155900 RepID=M1PVK5_9ZZZZ|nr:integral membrane protein [uncultured organism]